MTIWLFSMKPIWLFYFLNCLTFWWLSSLTFRIIDNSFRFPNYVMKRFTCRNQGPTKISPLLTHTNQFPFFLGRIEPKRSCSPQQGRLAPNFQILRPKSQTIWASLTYKSLQHMSRTTNHNYTSTSLSLSLTRQLHHWKGN